MIDDKFEAFTAEWIGELGVLNKKINELPASMDAALQPTKTLINNLSAQLIADLEAKENSIGKPNKMSLATISVSGSSTNAWLAAAAGTMLAFLAGLAVHFETVSQLLMGTFIFVAGGISCFFS